MSEINYLPECRRGHASSPGALYDQYEKAFDAAEKAWEALANADFNRRDYHEVNGFESIEHGLAKTKRIAMLKAIRDVIDYCAEHMRELRKQRDELEEDK
jgi:hypothetical protein